MSSATLTSLAMLKVNLDQGRDYLDYLRPFILQILVDHKPDPVTDQVIRDHLRTQFGLEIPQRVVQLVLKRLSKSNPLKKETGVYRITGTLRDPGIFTEKSKAVRHIQAVVSGLKEFSKTTHRALATDDDAVKAICAFLEEFNIPCLRAYLRGTAIPNIEDKHDSDIVMVGQYVLHLLQTDSERFDSFLIILQGHMLANALLCPDLQHAPRSYKSVTFYFDTPLLVRRLGLEGEYEKRAIEELIDLIRSLGGTVATFSHSRVELERVVKGAANHLDSRDGRGAIIMEARRIDTTKSDLLLLAGQIDDKLSEAKINVKDSPKYIADFQINEEAFEHVLDDEVSYFNPKAKEYDINSVRSIFALRAGTSPLNVEKAKAVLVTSNTGFARAAFLYGKDYEETQEVSSVITDFSLANMAWLKAPMGAPFLPKTEILAFSYAALRPPKKLLTKYMAEIDKLEKQGKITERDHQLLRSSVVAQEELMRLTLGEEDALNEKIVTETLDRITSEIKKEESEKLKEEEIAHQHTKEALSSAKADKRRIQERIYWRCRSRAEVCAWCVSGLLGLLLVVGLIAGLGIRSSSQIIGWALALGVAAVFLFALVNFFFGSTVKKLHQGVQYRCQTWFIKKAAKAIGLDLREFQ